MCPRRLQSLSGEASLYIPAQGIRRNRCDTGARHKFGIRFPPRNSYSCVTVELRVTSRVQDNAALGFSPVQRPEKDQRETLAAARFVAHHNTSTRNNARDQRKRRPGT
jgi:hypothetical protein